MEDEVKKFEKKADTKVVPDGCIRLEFDKYSVFKEIRGVKYFLGIKKTLKEAEQLYWSK